MDHGESLLVFGNMNIDMIHTVKDLPREGESAQVLSRRMVFGGCGGNIAIAAARAGIQVDLCSVIGKDFPEDYGHVLNESGVNTDLIRISEDLPSPYCIILSAPGGRQIYAFDLGSMAEQNEMRIPIERARRYVHIATSDPEFSIRASRELSGAGSEVSIDPGMEIYQRWSRSQLARVLQNCRRFFGNLGEWEHLGCQMGWKGDIHYFNGKGVPYFRDAFDHIEEAVITLGGAGSVIIDLERIHHEGPVEVGEVVDATGAGDAFRGGFYAALIRGYSSKEALRFGNAMGALSVKGEGPQNYEADWETLLYLSSVSSLEHEKKEV